MLKESAKNFYNKFHSSKSASQIKKVEALKQERRIESIRCLLDRFSAKGRILIAGCGSEYDLKIIDLPVFGFDISCAAVVKARNSSACLKAIVADARCLPFKNSHFDVLVCSEVLEHIENVACVINEFARILNKDGFLLITVPNWISLFGAARKALELLLKRKVTADSQPVDNWYTYKRLNKEIGNGFVLKEKRGAWFFPPVKWKNLTLIPDGLAFIIFKNLLPIERFFSVRFPWFSHIISVIYKKI